MAKIKLYNASIFRDGVAENICVDMTSLPYGKFDASHPLFIKSDVDMGKSKDKPALPVFSDVIIMGMFDCSSYTINQKTILPNGITALKCLHSISSLDDLRGILPSSVHKVIVRHAILNSVKKNDKNALVIAQQFVKDYPDVEVVSDKNVSLSDVLKDITTEKTTAPVKASATVSEKSYKTKTEEWLSTEELIQIFKSENSSIELSDKDIARFIRMARNKKSDLNLNKSECMCGNDVFVCVHRDDASKVMDFIRQQYVRATDIPKQAVVIASDPKPDRGIEPVAPTKYFVGNKEVQETVIKKYIKNNVWKEIQKHYKNNVDKQLEFLQAIEVINIRPVDTAGNGVYYIQDGVVQKSSTITFKNVQWLAQGFGTLDDRSRIVWCMNDCGFIATEYFEEHEKKQSVDYKKTIRQKDVSGITTADTMSVTELIAQLDPGIGANLPVAESAVPAKTEPASKPLPIKESTSNQKQLKIDSSANSDATQDVSIAKINWSEYDSLHASFDVKMKDLRAQQAVLLQQIADASNAVVALEYTQKLQTVLNKRKKIEELTNRMRTLKQELQNIKQEYLHQM